ncbi:hypothetical protein JOC75_004491 [Metabacillus crassostreae]|nr:hypothetical protein [Metabacillus crassostreae]MBM7606443.1 hypothetical protein [Metabacillus crassostreae]
MFINEYTIKKIYESHNKMIEDQLFEYRRYQESKLAYNVLILFLISL